MGAGYQKDQVMVRNLEFLAPPSILQGGERAWRRRDPPWRGKGTLHGGERAGSRHDPTWRGREERGPSIEGPGQGDKEPYMEGTL